MDNWCICWFFTHILTKYTVQEAKSAIKNLVLKRCAEGFNFVVKELTIIFITQFYCTNLYINAFTYSNIIL
jgi:hypothetical protein